MNESILRFVCTSGRQPDFMSLHTLSKFLIDKISTEPNGTLLRIVRKTREERFWSKVNQRGENIEIERLPNPNDDRESERTTWNRKRWG